MMMEEGLDEEKTREKIGGRVKRKRVEVRA